MRRCAACAVARVESTRGLGSGSSAAGSGLGSDEKWSVSPGVARENEVSGSAASGEPLEVFDLSVPVSLSLKELSDLIARKSDLQQQRHLNERPELLDERE